MIGPRNLEELQKEPMLVHTMDAYQLVDTLAALWKVAKEARKLIDDSSDWRPLAKALAALDDGKEAGK